MCQTQMEEKPISEPKQKCPWYLNVFWIWVWILAFGPLAIPLLVISPRFSKVSKIIISVILIALAVYFYHIVMELYRLMQNPQELKNALKNYLTADQMKILELFLEQSGKA